MESVTIAKHREDEESLDLPTGFRFHPRDEEIITYYLTPKVLNHSFCARAMGEVDLNKCEPWDLPSKAKMGEKEWYFFCQKDKKYPTGMRTNRATEAGYWKATGKDKEIYRGRGVLVGMKKTLVFYKGRAPRGGKTNWVMHEYRLEGKLPFSNSNLLRSSKDEWVVCKVFHKSMATNKSPMDGVLRTNSFDSTTLHPMMNQIYHYSTMWPGPSYATEQDTSNFTKLVALENQQELRKQFRSGNRTPSLAFYRQLPNLDSYLPVPFGSANLLDVDGTTHRTLAGTNNVSPVHRPPMASWSQHAGLSSEHCNTSISSVVTNHYDDVDVLLNGLESCLDCSILTCF